MRVEPISRAIADRIIKQNHYSGTVAFGTQVSLGIYKDNQLLGVFQLGKGVFPDATARSVEGTQNDQYMELNRLWLHDRLPHNSESQSIALMFKWMKKNRPEIKWLISFADGLEGNVGTIYQATNWIYTGYNTTGGMWITKDGKKMHALSASKGLANAKRETLEAKWGTPLYRVAGGQFRYIYFLDKRCRKNLRLQPQAYPKASDIENHISIYKERGRSQKLWEELREVIKKGATVDWLLGLSIILK